jgi:hypothetical protein
LYKLISNIYISANINTDTEIGNTVAETDCGHTERVRKRAFSGSIIPDTLPETQEADFFSEITNSNIVRACKRALVVQVETLCWLNFVQVITCTGQYCTSHKDLYRLLPAILSISFIYE